MIEFVEHLLVDDPIQGYQVENHARSRIDRPRNSHFQQVIVPVAVWVVAFSIYTTILFCAQHIIVQPMSSRESVATRQVNHYSP